MDTIERRVYACTIIQSCLTFAILWAIAHQAPLSMGFPRQEYWSGLPFPSPGDLPTTGIEPMPPESPVLAGGFFTTEPPVKPHTEGRGVQILHTM